MRYGSGMAGLRRRPADIAGAGGARPPAGTENTGGGKVPVSYYSRPEGLGAKSEDNWKGVSEWESKLMRQTELIEEAEATVKSTQKELETAKFYLEQAQEAYKNKPTSANKAGYEQMVSIFGQRQEAYKNAYSAYEFAYNMYTPYESAYRKAFQSAQDYDTEQKAQYDSWRGTVRQLSAVQAELDGIDAQISAAEGADSALAESLKQKKALLQEEYDWSRYFSYADLQQAADFGEKSKYVSTANGKKRNALQIMLGVYTPETSGWDDPMYEYINGNQEAGAYIGNMAAQGAEGIAKAFLHTDGNKSESQHMTDSGEESGVNEVAVYNYIYATQGKEAAQEYYNYLLADLNYRQRKADEQYWTEFAKKDPVGSTVFSVVTSPVKGLSYVGQFADYINGKPIDQNAGYNRYSYANSAIRKQVTKQIEESGKWGKVGSFAYQTGVSMGDFLMSAAASGGNQALSLAIMGTGAAADTTIEAKDRGLSDDQAFWLGTIAGAAEIATEKISIDALLDADLLKDSAGRYILKNMLAEGSEEVGSDAINLVADILISKDKSQWQQSIDAYVAEGKSEKEAFWRSVADQAGQMALDLAGGAISGGVFGGVGAASYRLGTNRAYKTNPQNIAYRDNVQALIQEGLRRPEGSESRTLAQGYQEKLDKGKKLTGVQIEKLIAAVDTDTVYLAVKDRLTELGEGGNVDILAQALTKQAMGQKLTWEEGNAVKSSAYAQRVSNELDLNNIRSGDYSSAWTESLKSYRADPQAFGAVQTGQMAQELNRDTQDAQGQTGEAETAAQAQEAKKEPPSFAQAIKRQFEQANELGSRQEADLGGALDTLSMTENNDLGGVSYERNQQAGTGPAAARPGQQADARVGTDGNSGAGNSILDGGQGRYAGTGAGKQAGGLAAGTGVGKNLAGEYKKTVDRQNLARDLRLEKVSSKEVGITSGTDAKSLRVMPQEQWDADMQQLAQRIYEETGKNVAYVLGRIQVRNAKGGVSGVRGVYTGETIIIQADNAKISIEQIADHEAYHSKVDFSDGRLNREIRRHITQTFGEEQLQAVLDKYLDNLYGVIGTEQDSMEELVRRAEEELFADAYAGINAFGAHAEQFTQAVGQRMEQLGMGKRTAQSNGTRQTNGPNGERFSFDQGDITREETEENIRMVAEMEPAAALQGDEFAYGGASLAQEVQAFFESVGGAAENERIGTVVLNKRSIKDDLAHGMSGEKAAAFAAVPDVIRNGLVVNYEGNWKNRGYESITIAAPITIRAEPYMMGVVIRRSNDMNRFYVHDVFTEKEATPFNRGPEKGLPGGATSTISIIDRILDVKRKTQNAQAAPGTISQEIERQWRERYSVDDGPETEGSDTDRGYMDAVDRGDTVTAQKLVDGAAKEWGAVTDYRGEPLKLYHGTSFFGFAQVDVSESVDGIAFFATDSMEVAEEYAGPVGTPLRTEIGQIQAEADEKGVYSLYFKDGRKLTVECGGSEWDAIATPARCRRDIKSGTATTYQIAKWAKEHGYDSVVFKDVYDPAAGARRYAASDVYAVFDGQFVKSADPVTYDDSGKVIPLSQRFDRGNKDIRYSVDDGLRDDNPDEQQYSAREGGTFQEEMQRQLRERFSYAGEGAQNADLEALAKAKDLQKAGVADETIRQQTGWFQGMDGKWRWEIDDSDMEYHRAGDAQFVQDHSEYARQQELMQKFFEGELTIGEEHELRQLNEIWGREYGRLSERTATGNATLENLIQHSELFDAYPQLRKTRVVFAEMEPGEHGSYDSEKDVIMLSEDIRNAPEDTLVHEVQHAIQNAEGFTPGASPEFWKKQRAGIIETISGARVNLDLWLKDIGYEDQMKASLLKVSRREKTMDQHWADMQDFKDRSKYANQIRACEEELAEYQRQYDEITRGMTPSEQYRNTAGEIEARDSSRRRKLDAAQRKNTRPDVRRTDVVFADDNAGYGLSKEEQDSVKEQLREHQDELNTMVPVAYVQDEGWRNMSTGQFRTKIVADLGKTGFRIERKGFGVIEFSEKELNRSLNYMRTDAESVAYQALPQVLKRGMEIGGHGDHKGRGYETVTLAAPVILNGERANMAVVVMQTKGNRYKVHRVLTPNGEAVVLPEKANAEPNTARRVTEGAYSSGGTNRAISSASTNTILHQNESVKRENGTKERYSVDDGDADTQDATEDFGAIESELKARRSQWDEMWLKDRLGEEDYQRYREYQKQQEAAKKRENAVKAKVKQTVEKNKRSLRKEYSDARADADARKRQAVAQEPSTAKGDFRRTVLDLFSIPTGSRNELGTVIDGFADRLLKNGTLTEDDRRRFFDRMYESGVMQAPADETFGDVRNYVRGGRMYVPGYVVAELGEGWSDLRRRAFGAGIYLTRDSAQAATAGGIDVWNAELAGLVPGLFDSEETDLTAILERIVQVAEEGKDERMSLPEYTAWLAGREGVREDEFLDNMERQLDWALRTFAEKARLEVSLKTRSEAERTGLKKENIRLRAEKAAQRQERKEAARRQQESKELKELQQKTLKSLQWLSKNRNRAPEDLKAVWDEVLGDIDLFAVSAADEMRWSDRYNATWKDLAEMYKTAEKTDPNFLPSKDLERIVARLDGDKIADMDLGALQDLYKAAVGLQTEFRNREKVIDDEMDRLFEEVYSDAKGEIEGAPGGYSGKKRDKFVNLDQLTPMNVMQRMGGWDPDGTFYSMARQLERGERDIRAYKVKANRMLESFLNEHQDWMKKADGQGKDAIWYEIEVPELLELGMGDKPVFGKTVKVWMTPAQKVHMYLESKSYDNLRHMAGGRTFADKELYSQGERQEAFAQGKTIRLAPETVKKLVSDLTQEEMELAQLLDGYYNGFATEQINRVSNVLYGYDKAMGSHYAPIFTNQNYTNSEFGVFDITAEGVGNLKQRQVSKNPSYNISAFEAFERNTDQTARFVGMAIPARNWTALMNWREKNNSMADVITHKWGDEGKKYISDLITTLQAGESQKTDTVSAAANKIMSNYISAVFGSNPGIVLKQLGSIPLAGAYLDFRNFPSLSQIRSIDKDLIAKYSQDLAWRTMGYSMPEIKQLKDNPNWTQTNKAFRFFFGGGAITAMDGWAASTLWPWAENKVRREYPKLEVGSKEQIDNGESPFYRKVAEEFEDAVARSQSTSDEIHQGTLRKSKNPVTKAFTLFRSDSAQTYNAIRQKIGEAGYQMRSGQAEQVVKTAKKAVGAAFCAMLINAAWSECVSFLMALWKHKDKRYRDDEEELTAQSIAGEMVSNMVGSLAGTVTGGEELYEVIGNILTGEKWYGIDTPGMEQLNDAIEAVMDAGGSMRELIAGGVDIVKNGGDLGQYFGSHSGQILGSVKEIAAAAATYLPGLSVNNLEGYLMGAFRWVAPELGAAYDDLFKDSGKADLAVLEGDALENRLGRILGQRKITREDATVAALAALYQEGCKGAVPSDVPGSVSVNGESRKLGEYQKQAYVNIWSGIVADGLDELVASEVFEEADGKTREKMLKKLYDYAADQAKAKLFDDYEVTDSRAETIALFREEGLSLADFLQVYGVYSHINEMDLKASAKAVEFSHWVNAQGYTQSQAALVRDEMTYFSMTPTSGGKYDELVDAGMDSDDAYALIEDINSLEPEMDDDGELYVSDIRIWNTCIEFSDDVDRQLTALSIVMSDGMFQKAELANDYGVTPAMYVGYQEAKYDFDADRNGGFTQAEVKAAIDSMSGLSKRQKAVLWQLANKSWKAEKNPYDKAVGQKIIDNWPVSEG